MKKRLTLLALPALLAAGSAQAVSLDAFDVGVTAGTLGAGPTLGVTVVPDTFRARLTTGFLDYSESTTVDGIAYEGDLELRNAALIGDYHPFGGLFRLSAGAVINGNAFDATGTVVDGETYTANGTTYTAGTGDSVNAEVDFDDIAPYVGLGLGTAGVEGGLSLSADIGVMFQGTPDAQITINTDAATQAAADRYAREAEDDLDDDLEDFELYPVIQVGAVYRF